MKVLSRDFTMREKILLLALAVLIIGIGYYKFIDEPVRSTIANAKAEEANLQMELTAVQTKVAALKKMEFQLENMTSSDKDYMPSYNNRKAEIKQLNDILQNAQSYSVTFDSITREGNQIRRNFTLQFTTNRYTSAESILDRLDDGPYRCKLNEVLCTSESGNVHNGEISVSAVATFYETVVGCTDEAGLPAETSEAENAE